MKNKLRKFISFALATSCASSIFVLSSCNDTTDTVERTTALRVFESSDGALDNFPYTVERVSFAAVKWNPLTLAFSPKSRLSATGTRVKLVLLIVVPIMPH